MNVNYKELYEQNIDSVRKRYPQKDPVEINLQNSFGDKLKLLDFNFFYDNPKFISITQEELKKINCIPFLETFIENQEEMLIKNQDDNISGRISGHNYHMEQYVLKEEHQLPLNLFFVLDKPTKFIFFDPFIEIETMENYIDIVFREREKTIQEINSKSSNFLPNGYYQPMNTKRPIPIELNQCIDEFQITGISLSLFYGNNYFSTNNINRLYINRIVLYNRLEKVGYYHTIHKSAFIEYDFLSMYERIKNHRKNMMLTLQQYILNPDLMITINNNEYHETDVARVYHRRHSNWVDEL